MMGALLGEDVGEKLLQEALGLARQTFDRSLAARSLYPEVRQTRPEALPRSPVIGTDAPVQYEQRDDIGAPRKTLPSKRSAAE